MGFDDMDIEGSSSSGAEPSAAAAAKPMLPRLSVAANVVVVKGGCEV